MEWTRENDVISDAAERIDIDFVASMLSTSYWAEGRSKQMVHKSIEHSIPFGVYREDRMIGFARVITDEIVFGWIADVIIHPDFRGNGLGTWLVECILLHPVVRGLSKVGLATRDAHGLYEKFGFCRRETMMLNRDESVN